MNFMIVLTITAIWIFLGQKIVLADAALPLSDAQFQSQQRKILIEMQELQNTLEEANDHLGSDTRMVFDQYNVLMNAYHELADSDGERVVFLRSTLASTRSAYENVVEKLRKDQRDVALLRAAMKKKAEELTALKPINPSEGFSQQTNELLEVLTEKVRVAGDGTVSNNAQPTLVAKDVHSCEQELQNIRQQIDTLAKVTSATDPIFTKFQEIKNYVDQLPMETSVTTAK